MRKTRESYDKEKVETKGMLSKRVNGHLRKEKERENVRGPDMDGIEQIGKTVYLRPRTK